MTDTVLRADSLQGRQGLQSDYACLAEGALYVVGGSVPVDGRISWYSGDHLGRYLPFNSYVLKDGDGLLLLESGVPAVFEPMADQLRSILGSRAAAARLAVTRNEPDCVANIPLLVRRLGLKTVHSPGLMNTLQFFRAEEVGPENSFNHRSTELQMLNFGVKCVPSVPGAEVAVSDGRVLQVMAVPLRVLPTVGTTIGSRARCSARIHSRTKLPRRRPSERSHRWTTWIPWLSD